MQVTLALQRDGTIAVQTALSRALVQWPFLHDTSIISAVCAVFIPTGARSEVAAAAANALDMTLLQPWLYSNLLLLDSQLFVPVLDKVLLLLCALSVLGSKILFGSMHCIPHKIAS